MLPLGLWIPEPQATCDTCDLGVWGLWVALGSSPPLPTFDVHSFPPGALSHVHPPWSAQVLRLEPIAGVRRSQELTRKPPEVCTGFFVLVPH